jgi:hypothetical protein
LAALLKDGVVEESTVGKRVVYAAGSPRKLAEAMRLTEQSSEAALARLVAQREKDVPGGVRFLRGLGAIRAAFDDVIEHCKPGETFYRYTSEQDLTKVNKLLAPDYRVRRDKKRLERLVISNYQSGSQKRSRLERFIKYIPEEFNQFQFNIIQLVYGKRMSIINLNTKEVTIIENQQLADFQKVIFKTLYKKL